MRIFNASILDLTHFTLAVGLALRPKQRFTLPADGEHREVLKQLFDDLVTDAVAQRVDELPDCYALTGRVIACPGSTGQAGMPFTIDPQVSSETFVYGTPYDPKFISEGAQVAADVAGGRYRLKYMKLEDGSRRAVCAMGTNPAAAILAVWSQLWNKPVGEVVEIKGKAITDLLGMDLGKFQNGCTTLPQNKFFQRVANGKFARLPEDVATVEFVCALMRSTYDPIQPFANLYQDITIVDGVIIDLNDIARDHFAK